ncbi:unnamed protein product [Anisakis simplex]|uniref:Uncharacterized protein n=1 Tax=Anisakis simplex TaxID=6269 RepID=A0A0M3J129_ANISI|nr:unnamed protein product [Anisakis simplex]
MPCDIHLSACSIEDTFLGLNPEFDTNQLCNLALWRYSIRSVSVN